MQKQRSFLYAEKTIGRKNTFPLFMVISVDCLAQMNYRDVSNAVLVSFKERPASKRWSSTGSRLLFHGASIGEFTLLRFD